jgi:hypothetical protein
MKKNLIGMLLGVGLASLVVAADMPAQGPIRNTQHLDSAGSVRLTRPIGHATVEGWDQAGFEITTIKSPKPGQNSHEREKVARNLDKVKVSARQNGDEIAVTTDRAHANRQGDITLLEAGEAKYAIDGNSDFGTVASDLPGELKRRFWLIGHRFARDNSGAAHKLKLRTGYRGYHHSASAQTVCAIARGSVNRRSVE